MAPQSPVAGLIVSKLGIEATASGDKVSGVLCLKISIPSDGPRSRQVLITESNHFTARSTILPLPLSTDDANDLDISTAVALLALPSTLRTTPRPLVIPTVEVSHGQVSIAMDSQRIVRSRNPVEVNRPTSTTRQDWLLILPFEMKVWHLPNTSSHIFLPLPKCLDNVLRFQISSDDPDAPLGDVSILTEPKILPMPLSSFDSPLKASGASGTPRGKLTEWSDANGTGASDSGTDGDAEGSWLQGRFQSTDALSLEWSISGPPSASSSLAVVPHWHNRRPTIEMRYEATIPTSDQIIPIEAVLPEGWGWSSLIITGDNLSRWTSVDGDFWDEAVSPASPDATGPSMSRSGTSSGMINGFESDQDDDLDLDHIEDSFTTLRNRSRARKGIGTNTYLPTPPASSSFRMPRQSAIPPTLISSSNASLLRQTMPKELEKMDDFSFELSSADEPPHSPRPADTPRRSVHENSFRHRKPATPRLTPPSSETSRRGLRESSSRRPSSGSPRTEKAFNLEFDDNDAGARSFVLEGTLSPLPLTLVSSSLSIDIPFIRIDHPDAATSCAVRYHNAAFATELTELSGSEAEYDTSASSIGTLEWSNDRSVSVRPTPIRGNVQIALRGQDVGGHICMSLSIPINRSAQEVAFRLPVTDGVEVVRASVARTDMPRAVGRVNNKGEPASEVRVGTKSRSGRLDITLELPYDSWSKEESVLPLPLFDGCGDMLVELRGDWGVSRLECIGNFIDNNSPSDNLRFIFALSTAPHLSFRSRPVSTGQLRKTETVPPRSLISRWRTRTLFSWSTLLNLLLFWLILSMGQQVQRLRNELAFVMEDTRDLRLYGLPSNSAPLPDSETPLAHSSGVMVDSDPIMQNDMVAVDSDKMSLAVGRVVFGDSTWRVWANHPTVQSVGRGVGWLWRAVVWLLVPG